MAYSYHRPVTIDYTKVGTNDSGELPESGFPVLVSLSGVDWLKTKAEDPTNGRIETASGYDIIFKQDSSTLYHEIEEYDGTTGTLVAWVRVDSLSKSADTIIYIYYGNADISSPTEDPTNVWDANYVGVWHLEEQVIGDTTSGTHYDSTSGTNNGIQNNNGPIAGKISGGQHFDGNDYIDIDVVADDINLDEGTFSLWVQLDDMDEQGVFLSTWVSNDDTIEIKWNNTIGFVRSLYKHDGTAEKVDDYDYDDTSAAWKYATITWSVSDDEVIVYTDGEQIGDVQDNLSAIAVGITYVSIGARGDFDRWTGMIGDVDEVRISNTARSADWIKTSYNNQNSPSTFYEVGPESTSVIHKFIQSYGAAYIGVLKASVQSIMKVGEWN